MARKFIVVEEIDDNDSKDNDKAEEKSGGFCQEMGEMVDSLVDNILNAGNNACHE